MRDVFFFGGIVFVMIVFSIGFSGVIMGNAIADVDSESEEYFGDDIEINWKILGMALFLFSSITLIRWASQYHRFKNHGR